MYFKLFGSSRFCATFSELLVGSIDIKEPNDRCGMMGSTINLLLVMLLWSFHGWIALCQQHVRIRSKDRPIMSNNQRSRNVPEPVVPIIHANGGETLSSTVNKHPLLGVPLGQSTANRIHVSTARKSGAQPAITIPGNAAGAKAVVRKAAPRTSMTGAITSLPRSAVDGPSPIQPVGLSESVPVKIMSNSKGLPGPVRANRPPGRYINGTRVSRASRSPPVGTAPASLKQPPRPAKKRVFQARTAPTHNRSKAYGPIKLPVNLTLDGNPMNPVKNCPPLDRLNPENIHLVTIASPYYMSENNPYSFSLETVRYYASLHGYHYRMVDPEPILQMYGAMNPDLPKMEVISSKSLIMLCKFE